MTIQHIARPHWSSFFNTISEALVGKRAEIEVASLDLGDQLVAEWLPLIGISYDHKDDLIAVDLEGVDHLIPAPRDLHVDSDPSGLISLEIIDADDRHQIIKLKDPLALPQPASNSNA